MVIRSRLPLLPKSFRMSVLSVPLIGRSAVLIYRRLLRLRLKTCSVLFIAFVIVSFFTLLLCLLFVRSFFAFNEASTFLFGPFRKPSIDRANSFYHEYWSEASVQARQNFPVGDIIDPGPDGNYQFNTTTIRQKLIQKFQTSYGCSSDPVVTAASGKRKTDVLWPIDSSLIPNNAQPEGPPRIALLFMVSGDVKQPKLWSYWFQQAREWSTYLYTNQLGPYSDLTDPLSWKEIPLFTVYTHDSSKKNSGAFMSQWSTQSKNGALPKELQESMVPQVETRWGSLNWLQHQLLHHAIQDKRNTGFIFISDSTVPVKPFSFIYNEFQQNPRSRFFFTNVNLPLVRKHDQWIVLNRRHTLILLRHPERWLCAQWLVQPYGTQRGSCWGAPDEYLVYHALAESVGVTSIQTEINDGEIYPYPIQDFNGDGDGQLHSDGRYRHTWVCWIENYDACPLVGDMYQRRASPVMFYNVFATPFEELVLLYRGTWFARKFSRDCKVEEGRKLSASTLMSGKVVHQRRSPTFWESGLATVMRGGLLQWEGRQSLEDWMIDKLKSWKDNDMESKLWEGDNVFLYNGTGSQEDLNGRGERYYKFLVELNSKPVNSDRVSV